MSGTEVPDNPLIQSLVVILIGLFMVPVFSSLRETISLSGQFEFTANLLLATPYLIVIVGVLIFISSLMDTFGG